MVDLAPFRGIRFHDSVPPEKGISPPYDAIDAALHRRLLNHHEKNSVRWTLGEDPENPTADEAEYVERGARIRQGLQEGSLVMEGEPALYRYTLEYTGADGARHTYSGLCGALAAGPWRESGVHPHEETKPHVVEDRLKLLMASKVDMGVVHLVNRDTEGSLTRLVSSAPADLLFSGEDFAGSRHQLERITDADSIRAIRDRLDSLDLVVADGHHRFTTFIESARRGEMKGGDRVLVTIADLDQPGMVIRPTHRVLEFGPRGHFDGSSD